MARVLLLMNNNTKEHGLLKLVVVIDVIVGVGGGGGNRLDVYGNPILIRGGFGRYYDQCYPSSDDNTNEDWQALGFSERDFESLGRDLNRPGSCMFALLLMIYLAVEENEAAGVVLKTIYQ
ncbi:hypothetical protein Pmar_PMAR029297 [Perkinsus marinus ATCC 50983]|uniref:Uncharacterized protein n=1 Tax=Perkinsus marinus (strain ATCC 50983 / TXsc) TaxID=423536 RepID=C5KMS3_PERM5|nr:hypothetical protein Pmar_PMAR029297 [Perkinsus marinus ATCC 50983]EER14231.1 hypothetical protein Pmar_PMAR029297 [Perkinsus marinus ATCC 50983]|eukprot:XP_002782436.1 hypothetical protein Pmar_PMAR029297 [Perkinsus marinus ATCC 50983]